MHIARTDWDTYFMLQAHLVATRSTCDRGPKLLFDPKRHGVGAVIVKDRRMIASGYNGSPPGIEHCCDVGHLIIENHCRTTIHSEMNAIIQCALDGVSPERATIYCTTSPCYDCAKVIIRAKIKRVVVAEKYESRYGLSSSVKELLEKVRIKMDYLKVTL